MKCGVVAQMAWRNSNKLMAFSAADKGEPIWRHAEFQAAMVNAALVVFVPAVAAAYCDYTWDAVRPSPPTVSPRQFSFEARISGERAGCFACSRRAETREGQLRNVSCAVGSNASSDQSCEKPHQVVGIGDNPCASTAGNVFGW